MKKMDKLFNEISIVFGFLGGILAYFLGGWDVLLKTIVCLAVLDYVTGVLKGIYLKQLSSETGFRGLLKKIVMFIVIAVAYLIQMLIGGTIPLREVVITFYICNEALSLLENAAVFVPIPERLLFRNSLSSQHNSSTDDTFSVPDSTVLPASSSPEYRKYPHLPHERNPGILSERMPGYHLHSTILASIYSSFQDFSL